MTRLALLLFTLGVLCLPPAVWARDRAEPAPATRGALTYTLSPGAASWPEAKRTQIVKAMDEALALYNRYAPFEKALRVSYVPSVPTADGNYNGHIRFGGTINTRIALHEISHTLGVGTTGAWQKGLRKGQWTGAGSVALVQGFDGPDTILRGDRQHFWPYGLNYDREDGVVQRVRHVLLVERLCRDMALPVFRR